MNGETKLTITRKNVELPIKSIVFTPNNARTHSAEQVDQIVASIKEFGFTNPVLVDETLTLIAGNGRVMAATKMGLPVVPAVMLEGLSAAQKRALVLADNKLALNAGWDDDILAAELSGIAAMGFNMDLTGFTGLEIGKISGLGTAEVAEDDLPEPPVVPVSVLGDIWQCGPHRVACGSSTDAHVVEALLAGAKPNIMVTDPPYGVEYDADWRNKAMRADGSAIHGRAVGKVLNDDRADWREAWALFPGNIAYVWHAGNMAGIVQESLEVTGFKTRAQIIWAKNNFAIGRGDYHWQHEPCWYAVKNKGNWTGDRSQTTVWNIDKPQKSETGHSTQKPVDCMRIPMLNNSAPGDIVYDPFLGSGTTVIAAETSGRICYGCELNPIYCDIIVDRWEQLSGGRAVHAVSGAPFTADSEVAA